MDDLSIETNYWVKGFLNGNQPEPPYKKDEKLSLESKEYKKWLKAVGNFNETGYWEN